MKTTIPFYVVVFTIFFGIACRKKDTPAPAPSPPNDTTHINTVRDYVAKMAGKHSMTGLEELRTNTGITTQTKNENWNIDFINDSTIFVERWFDNFDVFRLSNRDTITNKFKFHSIWYPERDSIEYYYLIDSLLYSSCDIHVPDTAMLKMHSVK